MIRRTSACEKPETHAPKTRSSQYAILAAVCTLVIGVYAWNARSGALELSSSAAKDSYYNLLVEGLRAGQLNLEREVPPGLAQLPDFFDPVAQSWFLDLSYYQGKLYLYFGVTPALLLLWPYVAVTGEHLLHKDAAWFFFSVGFLASAGLLWGVWRRYFTEVSVWVAAAGALALGLTNFAPAILVRSDVFEVAISCGYALTMVALLLVWQAMHADGRRFWWLGAASLAYGLALGARPSLLFGAVLLLVPVFQGRRQNHRATQMDPDSRRNPVAGLLTSVSGKLLLAATVPITVIGLGLLVYNYLRFADPLEFGQRHQLPAGPSRQFSLDYLWFNFRVCFLAPAQWSLQFPFVHDIRAPALPAGHGRFEHPFGILSNIPVVWLALAAPLAWRNRLGAERRTVRWAVTAVALWFVTSALTLCLHDSMVLRYEVEFAGTLVLLAAMGIFGVERALAGRRGWRLVARCCWGLALVCSLIFNLFAMVGLSSEYCVSRGVIFYRNGQMEEAIVELQKALKLQPRNVEAHNSLGMTLLRQGKVPEGIWHLEEALRLKPDFAKVRHNLATALFQQGKVAEAIRQLEQVLQLAPEYAEARHNLALVLLQQGKVAAAIGHLERALWLMPDSDVVRNTLGSALAQQGEELAAQGKWDEAIQLYQQAVQVRTNYAPAYERLGVAFSEAGRFEEAVQASERGAAVARATGNNDLAALIESRLKHYRESRPYHAISKGTGP